MKIITKEVAKSEGFVPITFSFYKHEEEMLKDAIKQLDNRPYRIVQVGKGLQLWRDAKEVEEIYRKKYHRCSRRQLRTK